jgi:hypothetical protein
MVEFEDEQKPRNSHTSKLRHHLREVHTIVTATSRPGGALTLCPTSFLFDRNFVRLYLM